MVLVQLDGVGVSVEVVAAHRGGGPVRVGAPAGMSAQHVSGTY